jgi:hypothetical protein
VLAFADHAAHQIRRGVQGEIHSWLEEVAQRLALDHVDIAEMCESTRRRLTQMRRYYFVVQLSPDEGPTNRYLLSAWLQHDRSPEEPIRCDDDAVPLDQAIERLYDLLQHVPNHIDDEIEELLVELILPRALITRPVDQWQVDPDFPHVLGTAYPVVVRSLDRLRSMHLHAPWGKKWRWLTTNGHKADPSYFLDVETHDHPAVTAVHATLLRNEPPIGLVMRTPPPESERLGTDAFSAGLHGGAPIMLWCRDSTMLDAFKDQIRIRFAAGDLLGLPQRVFELRLLAAEHANSRNEHVGAHVTLLWDDFDRIPEKFRPGGPMRPPQPRTVDTS